MAVLDEMKKLEDQRQAWMAQLGEIYYKNCKMAGEPVKGEAAKIIEKLDDLETRMKQLAGAGEETSEQQVENQGKVCQNCGAPVEEDQVFCVNCGNRLESPKEEEENTCPNCGAPVEEGQGFCIVCGMKLGQSLSDGSKKGPQRPAGPKICPSCGKVLPPQMHFCTACGTKVD